jgi:hypothetical protein
MFKTSVELSGSVQTEVSKLDDLLEQLKDDDEQTETVT